MALNTMKCNHLMPLPFKWLKSKTIKCKASMITVCLC